MKKIIALAITVSMLSTVAFCLDATEPNPPMKVAPIGDTINR